MTHPNWRKPNRIFKPFSASCRNWKTRPIRRSYKIMQAMGKFARSASLKSHYPKHAKQCASADQNNFILSYAEAHNYFAENKKPLNFCPLIPAFCVKNPIAAWHRHHPAHIPALDSNQPLLLQSGSTLCTNASAFIMHRYSRGPAPKIDYSIPKIFQTLPVYNKYCPYLYK